MFSYVWPIALVVLSNTVYQICSKSIPQNVSPFASLSVTYLVAAVMCIVLHFVLRPGESFTQELGKLNLAPYLLGVVIIGLEVGWVYAYRAGWQVSMGFVVSSAFLAVLLVFVGAMLYKEAVTWNKLCGIGLCLAGLVFLNLK